MLISYKFYGIQILTPYFLAIEAAHPCCLAILVLQSHFRLNLFILLRIDVVPTDFAARRPPINNTVPAFITIQLLLPHFPKFP